MDAVSSAREQLKFSRQYSSTSVETFKNLCLPFVLCFFYFVLAVSRFLFISDTFDAFFFFTSSFFINYI